MSDDGQLTVDRVHSPEGTLLFQIRRKDRAEARGRIVCRVVAMKEEDSADDSADATTAFGIIDDFEIDDSDIDKMRLGMKLINAVADRLTLDFDSVGGLYAIAKWESEQSFSLTLGNKPLDAKLLGQLGAQIVMLSESPPESPPATVLLSFSSVAPQAGRIVGDNAQLAHFVENLFTGIPETDLSISCIKTCDRALKMLARWQTQPLGLDLAPVAWNYCSGMRIGSINPFPSFEFDLLAHAFVSRGDQVQVESDQVNADEADLEAPCLMFSNCAIALHFVGDAAQQADGIGRQADTQAVRSWSEETRFSSFEVIVPQRLRYSAEGKERELVIPSGNRVLKFTAHLSRTRVRGLTDVSHLVLNPLQDLTAYDLIKISKLWAAGEESRTRGHVRSQLRFRIDGCDHSFEGLRGELTRITGQPNPANLRLRGGTIQVAFGNDPQARPVFDEVIAIATANEGHLTPADERSPELIRGLLELAGIKTSILDFEYVDALEIDETFGQPIMPDENAFFLGLHKGTLVHFSLKDRAFSEAKSEIGISPYLLLPHAVLLHNEKCLLDAEAAAQETIGQPEIEVLRRCEIKIREKVQQHLQPNVFQYPTEQAIYEFGHENRGLHKLRSKLDDQLRGINGLLEEEIDKKKYGSEVFVLIAGLLIGIGQFMSGWQSIEALFFEQPQESLAAVTASGTQRSVDHTVVLEVTAKADGSLTVNPKATPSVDMPHNSNEGPTTTRSQKFFFQVVLLTLLFVLLWYAERTWRNLIKLHGQRRQMRWLIYHALITMGLSFLLAIFIAGLLARISLAFHSPWATGLAGLCAVAGVVCLGSKIDHYCPDPLKWIRSWSQPHQSSNSHGALSEGTSTRAR